MRIIGVVRRECFIPQFFFKTMFFFKKARPLQDLSKEQDYQMPPRKSWMIQSSSLFRRTLCLSGQLYLYPVCKSWWMEKGDQASFGVEECWDYPDSTVPRLNIQTVSWQELAPLRTDKIPNKGSLDKPTSYSNDNLSKAAELKAAELQCDVLGVDTLTDCDFSQEKSRYLPRSSLIS